MDEFLTALGAIRGLYLLEEYPASKLTTFEIGGPIAYVLYPQSISALVKTLRVCHLFGIPWRVIGRGSNLLARDEGYAGAWIMTEGCSRVRFCGCHAEAECGISLSALTEECAARGLGGLENLWGIPGTLGGACVMNAGAFGTRICDLVQAVNVYDPVLDRHSVLGFDACLFGYRESVFQHDPLVVTGVSLRLANSRTDLVRSHMDQVGRKREASQPLDYPSAGSVFRRPAGAYAGRLIQEAGLSGYRIGGAAVSEKHAGFIVNLGGASAKNVRDLIGHIQKAVYQRSGILLKTELIEE